MPSAVITSSTPSKIANSPTDSAPDRGIYSNFVKLFKSVFNSASKYSSAYSRIGVKISRELAPIALPLALIPNPYSTVGIAVLTVPASLGFGVGALYGGIKGIHKKDILDLTQSTKRAFSHFANALTSVTTRSIKEIYDSVTQRLKMSTANVARYIHSELNADSHDLLPLISNLSLDLEDLPLDLWEYATTSAAE